jgi:hypothetical protein
MSELDALIVRLRRIELGELWPDESETIIEAAAALEGFAKMQQSAEAEFDVHIDGEYFASTCGPREDAWREAMGYVGTEAVRAEVFEVFRLPIPIGDKE